MNPDAKMVRRSVTSPMTVTSMTSPMTVRSVTLLALLLFVGFCAAEHREESKQPCKVIPLKSRTGIRAGTVFSGTVVSFLFPKRTGRRPRQYAARVVVKRVFQGDRGLRGGSVIVEGLGNPNICVSRPRLGDARISVAADH